jgi:hypothetical protein
MWMLAYPYQSRGRDLRQTDLATRMVPQIQPLYIEPTMIKRMNHLVDNRIFHMPF